MGYDRKLFCQYMKPFTKNVPPPLGTKDKKYSSSGNFLNDEVNCPHDYCMAEKKRYYGLLEEMENQPPVGLPWSSGLLKHLPGHVKVEFPLRKNKNKRHTKKPQLPPPDNITNPDVCEGIDEMLYAYKVFMLAGMVITEAKKEMAQKQEESEKENTKKQEESEKEMTEKQDAEKEITKEQENAEKEITKEQPEKEENPK